MTGKLAIKTRNKWLESETQTVRPRHTWTSHHRHLFSQKIDLYIFSLMPHQLI